jgi:hypothetical protein
VLVPFPFLIQLTFFNHHLTPSLEVVNKPDTLSLPCQGAKLGCSTRQKLGTRHLAWPYKCPLLNLLETPFPSSSFWIWFISPLSQTYNASNITTPDAGVVDRHQGPGWLQDGFSATRLRAATTSRGRRGWAKPVGSPLPYAGERNSKVSQAIIGCQPAQGPIQPPSSTYPLAENHPDEAPRGAQP